MMVDDPAVLYSCIEQGLASSSQKGIAGQYISGDEQVSIVEYCVKRI